MNDLREKLTKEVRLAIGNRQELLRKSMVVKTTSKTKNKQHVFDPQLIFLQSRFVVPFVLAGRICIVVPNSGQEAKT